MKTTVYERWVIKDKALKALWLGQMFFLKSDAEKYLEHYDLINNNCDYKPVKVYISETDPRKAKG